MARTPKTEKSAPVQTAEGTDAAEVKYPRRTERRRRTREKILRVASDHFIQHGFSASTMQNIADAADIHVTTLFMHFNSKNDLAAAIASNGAEDLRERALNARETLPFFDFFREEALAYAASRKSVSQPDAALWNRFRHDRELAFAWTLYEQGQKDVYADYIATEYKLDRASNYIPDLVAALIVESLVLAHEKWAAAASKRKLADEINVAVEIVEKIARPLLTK